MATFKNQAQLTYDGRTVVSNVVSGEITEPLSITMNALVSEYSSDDTVTYVITLTNSGQAAVTNVTLTDDLGAYAFGENTLVPLDYTVESIIVITNGTIQPTPTVSSVSPLTVEGIAVPAGGNTVVIYETHTNAYTPLETEGSITNTVTAESAVLVDSITTSETVTATAAAELTMIKSLSPDTVVTSGTVTYTFEIANTGNTASPADVMVIDTFDPALNGISVTFNGTAWTEGAGYNYDPETGVFSTVAGQITVPAASFSQDTTTGEYIVTPGTATLVVTGTI